MYKGKELFSSPMNKKIVKDAMATVSVNDDIIKVIAEKRRLII